MVGEDLWDRLNEVAAEAEELLHQLAMHRDFARASAHDLRQTLRALQMAKQRPSEERLLATLTVDEWNAVQARQANERA